MSPKVTSYTAPWLSTGSIGAALFDPPPEPSPTRPNSIPHAKKKPQAGPRRTIARRGTEIFVAAGKEIRWGDLAWLKEKYEASPAAALDGIKRETSDAAFEDVMDSPNTASGLRVIKTPVADDIRQLSISPNNSYLAILTTHTVHICLIPDSSHLSSEDQSIIRPKVWTLGPTTHVTSKSSVASALWHPLGVNGSCIVTVTTDAVVRLWELSLKDRWSFDAPTLSIDLKKLVDGTTLDQDYTASAVASNNSGYFSVDSIEMEVAAAAFASRGSGEWSPMILWVAMREGDLYALCPLLPQKWAPPPTLIPSLTVSIVTKVAAMEDDPSASAQAKLLAQNQQEWIGEIDNQEPNVVDFLPGEPLAEVYTRPSLPGIVPRLQGPFTLTANPAIVDDLDGELTDIVVIGKKVDMDDLMAGEEEDVDLDDGNQEGLSLNVICLLSTSGQVRVYLDLDGVEAQWLPPKSKSKHASPLAQSDSTTLLTFQIIDTMAAIEVAEDSWPQFSQDVLSRYNFFVTHHAGITFVSLSPWVFRLESDLGGDSDVGSDFRLGLLANSQSARDRLYTRPVADVVVPLAASSVIRDPDVGYFLLSATPYESIALTFDDPELGSYSHPRESTPPRYEEAPPKPLDFYEPRPAFKPSHVFDQASELPTLLARLKTSRHKHLASQEVRLSPVTLQIFTDAHRVLSDETFQFGKAASEVFRRCTLLQAELKHQVIMVNEVKAKIDKIAGRDGDSVGESDDARFNRRIEEARDRQERISLRLDNMRALVGKGSTRELSDKERAFADEISSLEASIIGTPNKSGEVSKPGAASLARRLEEVKRLKEELVADLQSAVRRHTRDGETNNNDAASSSPRATGDLRVPNEIRKAKLQQVWSLLDRETALVEAVSSRLERLQVNAP